ncbi:MAG: hypothetical protein ACE5GX_04515 [Thermoanaerobaculia bacterium]
MKRDFFGTLFLATLIVVAAGLALITRFPDAGWVHAVSRAAVFGPWIEKLAEMYRSPAAPAGSGELEVEGGPVIVYEIDLANHEARPRVVVSQGAILYKQPSEESRSLTTIGATSNLRLFERDGDWYQVLYGRQKGWVLLPPQSESGEPPLGSEPAPPLPVAARLPDPEVLAAARGLLVDPLDPERVGPYDLHTDVRDRDLLEVLSELAAELDSVYAKRFGLRPIPEVAEAVVLFSSRRNYEQFQRIDPETRFLLAPGMVRRGVVATYVGDRRLEEIATSLIHELTHLTSRRAVGPALPPWLEEGLADDLAQSRIENRRVVPGTLGGSFEREANRTEFRGGRAAAVELKRAFDRESLPSLETLVALDWDEFQGTGKRSLRYAQSSFFVRSLLDSRDPELARGFRAFLKDVARGQPLTAEALRSRLGRSWSALDKRLESFVRLQVVEEGLPVESASSSRQAAEPSS